MYRGLPGSVVNFTKEVEGYLAFGVCYVGDSIVVGG